MKINRKTTIAAQTKHRRIGGGWAALLTFMGLLGSWESANAGDLKVMTWNIQGGKCGDVRDHIPSVAMVIRSHKVDVVALQEVYLTQVLWLHQLTGYYYRFYQTIECDDDSRGLAILSRYPYGNSARARFLLPPEKTGEVRMVMSITIRVRGQLLHIYNTHLSAVGFSSENNSRRLGQVIEILDFVQSDADRPHEGRFRPILLGDFNSQQATDPYGRTTSRFRDAWLLRHDDSRNNPRGFTERKEMTRVDYIFLGNGSRLSVDGSGVLNTESLSDHFPVIALLSFVD